MKSALRERLAPELLHHRRGHDPDEAAMKLLYLVLRQVAGEWKMPSREWCEAKNQFAIMFEGRFVRA